PAGPARDAAEAPRHNLRPGSPDVGGFPRAAWLTSARRALQAAPADALRMGDPRGRIELRAAIADYLARTRGVRVRPDNVVITAGTRHAVEILARMFGAARPIAVEAYGLFLFRDAIAALGGSTVPIGLDDGGAVVSDLDTLDVPAALLTPAHHFPHGVPLHRTRRAAAVAWARRVDGYVIEDDYDGEFRYDRQPVGALQSLDPDRVIYLGSASKSLSPVLRLGWMALPECLVDPAVQAAGGQQWHTDGLAALTLADFIACGGYDKHIRRMRAVYRRRRDLLVARLAPLAPEVRISGLPAGLHALLLLPDGAEADVLRRAEAAGIGLDGLAPLRHPDAGSMPRGDGVLVNFAGPGEHAYPEAVNALCAVLAQK
ncbi:PLP-dependent aminotransferase family protein, partial [Mycolicibacterium brumae]